MASASDDQTVRIWVVNSGDLQMTSSKETSSIGPRAFWKRFIEHLEMQLQASKSNPETQNGYVSPIIPRSKAYALAMHGSSLQIGNSSNSFLLVSFQTTFSPFHTSFSVFGLLFFFVFWNDFHHPLAQSRIPYKSCEERRKLYQGICLEWNLNETLQLQRLVHEEIGIGA